MVVLGTDAQKRNHTVVAADEAGVGLGSITAAATPEGHLRLVKWAARWPERRWAIEDCRALSQRLEGDLLKLGEQVVRVPPKMMAGVRRSGLSGILCERRLDQGPVLPALERTHHGRDPTGAVGRIVG